jgi:hypothetical protein
MLLYTIELPFFEQFRVNEDPWLWHTDPKESSRLMQKAGKALLLNLIGLSVMITGLSLGFTRDTDPSTMPGLGKFAAQSALLVMIHDL